MADRAVQEGQGGRAVLRFAAMVGIAWLLQACAGIIAPSIPTLADVQNRSQMVSVPLNKTWIYAPTALAALERGLLNYWEQRIALANQTTVPGDNVLVLQARQQAGQEPGRFRYDDFVSRIGGLPEPFQATKSGDLLAGQDELGPYFWAEVRYGDATVCVLGVRHLTVGIRQLPGDTNTLDVMLRNCVNGTAEDALKPITAASIQNYPDGSGGSATGRVRMLSPLAGTIPQ